MVYYLNYIIRKKAFLHLLYYSMFIEPKEFYDEKIVFFPIELRYTWCTYDLYYQTISFLLFKLYYQLHFVLLEICLNIVSNHYSSIKSINDDLIML